MSVKSNLDNPQCDGTGGSPSVLGRMKIVDIYLKLKAKYMLR